MSTSETVEILRKAKALIDAPEKWTQRQYARNHAGDPICVLDDSATCFCVVGALARSAEVEPHEIEGGPFFDLLRDACGGGVISFNDREYTCHDDVMAIFDRAIELASKQEA